MEIDYTVGDEIYAIKDHSQGAYKKGDLFKAKAIRSPRCKCGSLVDVGLKTKSQVGVVYRCVGCETILPPHDGIWWLRATNFRKLDNIQISEVYEVLEAEPLEV